MSDKHWKSCSGPFWAECHADMEAQESRIRALEAACRVLAKAIAASRAVLLPSGVEWSHVTDEERKAFADADRGVEADPLAAKYIEEARNG